MPSELKPSHAELTEQLETAQGQINEARAARTAAYSRLSALTADKAQLEGRIAELEALAGPEGSRHFAHLVAVEAAHMRAGRRGDYAKMSNADWEAMLLGAAAGAAAESDAHKAPSLVLHHIVCGGAACLLWFEAVQAEQAETEAREKAALAQEAAS